MTQDVVIVTKEDGIATIVLNRPAAHNALTPEMLCKLADTFFDFLHDPALRVAILTGAGEKAFCAGGDLGRTLPLMTGARQPEDAFDRRVLEDPMVMPFSGLNTIEITKPIIAAVNGFCLAAGTEILLGTDIRIAAEHATFGLPEPKHGLIPFSGALVRLPRHIPYCHAMEILLTGDAVDAARARDMGLVNAVVPAADVLPRARDIARRIARNGPFAVQRIKETVQRASGLSLEDGFRLEAEAKRAVMQTDDAREGPRAFMEKRPPAFNGR